MLKKKFAAVAAFAAAAVLSVGLLTGCGGGGDNADSGEQAAGGDGAVFRTLDDIKASGTIKIGVFSDKNPFGYVDENGEHARQQTENTVLCKLDLNRMWLTRL